MGPNKQRRKTARRKSRQIQKRQIRATRRKPFRPDVLTGPAMAAAAAAMLTLPRRS